MPEDEGVIDGNLPLDPVVHGVHVRLVDRHALLGERGRVVDRDVLQFRVERPVFIWGCTKYVTVDISTCICVLYVGCREVLT